MKQRISIICAIVMMVLLVVGCGPTQTGTSGTTHQVTDGTGTVVTVANEPKRIVPIGTSTEDIVLSLVDPSRVAAIGTLPNNVPDAASKVEKHVKASAESLLSVQPDLVLIPNWMSPDAIGEMRNMQIPVYVYKTPTTVEEAKATIHEIAELLHASDESMIASMDADLKTVEDLANKHTGPRPVVAFYSQFGLNGGKGSTFDDMCKYMSIYNAPDLLGLPPRTPFGDERVLAMDPDYIFIPSYKGMDNSLSSRYLDNPAFQNLRAIRENRVKALPAAYLYTMNQHIGEAMLAIMHTVYPQLERNSHD